MDVVIPGDALPPLVRDIGLIAGLLKPNGTDATLDFTWFEDPVSTLEAIPSRRSLLWQALGDLLGTPLAVPPVAGEAWYALPSSGAASPVHIVCRASGAAGRVALGILDTRDVAGATVTASLTLPVLDLAGDGSLVVAGTAGFPIRLLVDCAFPGPVPVGAQSFSGVSVEADIALTGAAPTFRLSYTGATAPPDVSSLADLLAGGRAAIDAALATPQAAQWLGAKIGSTGLAVGMALCDGGLLAGNTAPYALADLSRFTTMSAVAIAEALLAGGLDALAQAGPLVTFGSGHVAIFKDGAAGHADYGLELVLTDVSLGTVGPAGATLQLGKLLSADGTADWITRCDAAAVATPGVRLALLAVEAGVPSLEAKLDLVSIGLDLAGTAGNPLFGYDGVSLNGVELRFLGSWDLVGGTAYWGAAIGVDALAIPLGGGSGAVGNPVALNLLSAGSGGSGSDPAPVNPSFSASFAGIRRGGTGTFDVELHSPLLSGHRIWLPIQRSFGPLQCRRLGVGWPDDGSRRLTFSFDGGVALAALAVDLEGLSLSIPLATPGDVSSYGLDLQGLGIAYASGPLTISGGFLRSPGPPVSYGGAALIRAATWTVAAEGSYALDARGHPSLFVFAQLGAELGGPPAAFVTGLCAGFGYNRGLRIPTAVEVPGFPLLAGIDDPDKVGGSGATPAQALAALEAWIPPAQGVNWIAAGVQFTSFELVRSNVVAVALMAGDDFTLAVLGQSRLKLAQAGPLYAYVELNLSVVFRPAAGYLGASASLSPASYVIDEACHLTGGFAFWMWYAGDFAGDFVVTAGGYHPAFEVPPHYPREPRLGFAWNVDADVTITGAAYFALTPACVMGGGQLSVVYRTGDLHAWFVAQADFLFTWHPYYFTGDVSVSIGASYRLDLLFTSVTVSVELGASLAFWGPPTGGTVHISWYVISFTVPFGSQPAGVPDGYVAWDAFAKLLPRPAPPPGPTPAPVLASGMADDAQPWPITLNVGDGLHGRSGALWLVRGDSVAFAVATPVPATEAVLGSAAPIAGASPIALRPMGIASVSTTLTLTMSGGVDLGKWSVVPHLHRAPSALWGPPLPAGTNPTQPSADTVPDCIMGVSELRPPETVPTGPAAFPAALLAFHDLDVARFDFLPLTATETPSQAAPQPDPASVVAIAATAGGSTRRDDLFAALRAFGYDPRTEGSTGEIAANAYFAYPDPPMTGAPWKQAA